MHGVILGINLHDYTSELKTGDLIVVDDGFEDFTILEKIDLRHGCQPDDQDHPYPYFVRSKSGDRLINYSRVELSKAHIAFFDYEAYYNHGKRILLGNISYSDINHIKGKFACDSEIPFSEFHNIKMDDIIGQDFYGQVETKVLSYDCSPDDAHGTTVKYFKIDMPD